MHKQLKIPCLISVMNWTLKRMMKEEKKAEVLIFLDGALYGTIVYSKRRTCKHIQYLYSIVYNINY